MSREIPFGEENSDLLVQLVHDLRDPSQREITAARLWSLLHEFLVSRIAARIADHLQGKVSAESVAQEAWASFFHSSKISQYRFDDSDDVRNLLFTIARNKLIDRIRRLTAQKRSPQRSRRKVGRNAAAADSADSELFHSDMAERNNVDSGEFAAGRLVSEPQKLKRGYNQRREEALPHEMLELAANGGVDWLNELLADADPLAAEVIKERVETLDDDLKTVLRLRLVDGYTLAELPGKLNRSFKQVRLKWEALEEAFLDLYDDSLFGVHAPKHRPRRSP